MMFFNGILIKLSHSTAGFSQWKAFGGYNTTLDEVSSMFMERLNGMVFSEKCRY